MFSLLNLPNVSSRADPQATCCGVLGEILHSANYRAKLYFPQYYIQLLPLGNCILLFSLVLPLLAYYLCFFPVRSDDKQSYLGPWFSFVTTAICALEALITPRHLLMPPPPSLISYNLLAILGTINLRVTLLV